MADVDELIERADEAFAADDFAGASAGWEQAYQTDEVQGDPELSRDVAWNIGLAEALQQNVERSRWYFSASQYDRSYFESRGVEAVYDVVMAAPDN